MELLLEKKKAEPKVNEIYLTTTDPTILKQITKDFNGRRLGTEGAVTVASPSSLPSLKFDCASFLKNLRTKYLGQTLAYGDWVSSTQTLQINSAADNNETPPLHDLPFGCVFITSHQVKGVGRGKNVWDSPLGCLMFTLKFQTTTANMVFLQYVVALSMVKALRSLPSCADLDINIKWPNDFYVNKLKIGGILHQSVSTRSTADHYVGIGLNVSNSKPTTCINDFVVEGKAPITREAVLGAFLTVLEGYISILAKEGFKPFLSDYLGMWLHRDQKITLKVGSESATKQAIIKGISLTTAALLAEDCETKEMHEVWPDGNSFDFLSGLIAPKAK